MITTPSIEDLAAALTRAGTATHHRRLVVMAGDRGWGVERANEVIAALTGEWCWIGENAPATTQRVDVAQSYTLLGSEWSGLVYDARAGFDPDAFGAVAGTLCAGGLLLLLTPPLVEWGQYPDPQRSRISVYPYSEEQVGRRFLSRLVALLQQSNDVSLIEQGKPLPEHPQVNEPVPSLPPSPRYNECASADQQAAVEALCRVAQGHRRRPLVLVSDRGRGKSTALGLAAARLLQQGVRRIVVTAPRLTAVTALFQHAAERLPAAKLGRGSLKLADGSELVFEPPDRLVQENIPCDLLLVDEAAAIPASLLAQMLRRHSRIAFATTVHGYEGTGRGFDLRFSQVLDEVTPEWRRLRLEQPIRWAEGDPLERLVFRALLLDAEPASDETVADIALEDCQIERVDRDALASGEALLSQLFGLLVLAHYRTSPADLRNLLDGPNIEVVVLRHREQILATALLAGEGGFDEALSRQVYEGKRRLRGNLLPQSLTVHAGIEMAACLRGARVMRIAVHPARQGEGFGSRLMDGLLALTRKEGFDYLGASFGATPELLDFWHAQGCLPVRLGLKREASSGMVAAMVMHPLSPAGDRLFAEARQRLLSQLPTLLSEPLCELEPPLVERLLGLGEGVTPPALNESLWADISSFALARRDYGNCLMALQALLLISLKDGSAVELLSPRQRALLISKLLQRRPWQAVADEYALRGRGEVIEQLRGAYGQLCHHYGVS